MAGGVRACGATDGGATDGGLPFLRISRDFF